VCEKFGGRFLKFWRSAVGSGVMRVSEVMASLRIEQILSAVWSFNDSS
jgi:hypothetical protein